MFWKAEIVHEKCVEMQLDLAGISFFFVEAYGEYRCFYA